MASNFEVLKWVANGSLSRFKTNTIAVGKVRRDIDDEFGTKGRMIGNVFYFRRNPAFYSVSGSVDLTSSFQDYYDPSPIPIYIGTATGNNPAGSNLMIPIQLLDQDYKLKFDEMDERLSAPCAEQLGTDADRLVTKLYQYVGNTVGTIGTPISGSSSYKSFLQARAMLNKEGAPKENRWVLFDPDLEVELADYLKQFPQQPGKGGDMFAQGTLTAAAGLKWGMTQDLYTHTAGAVTVGSTVNTAVYGGPANNVNGVSVISITGGTGTLKCGDVISFAGYYACNPRTKQSLGYLRQFSVVGTTSANGTDVTLGSPVSMTISPAIEPAQLSSGVTNPYQNVTAASPNTLAASTAIYVWGQATSTARTGTQNLAFCPDAFAFANVKLPLFDGLHLAARATDSETGLSLRVSQQWDILTTKLRTRLDMACGVAGLIAEQACRVTN